MRTDRKTLGIIIIVVGLILIFLIIYFGFFKKTPTTSPTEATPTINQPSLVTQDIGTTTLGDKPRRQTYDISKETPHKLTAEDLAQRGMAFAERLGTYSNYSNYDNFTDLKISVTDSFGEWVDKYVAQLKSQVKDNSTYYGLETKALTTEIKSFDDSAGTAQIIITTKRSESTDKIGGGTPYIQKLDLDFLRVNGEWLVDKAYWEK
jgi:hypothetical protein